MGILQAGFWGGVGGISLLLGAIFGLYLKASQKVISMIMAVGAGVLISSIAFELMSEAYKKGGFDASAIGLILGSVIFFIADWAVCQSGGKHRKRSQGQQSDGSAMAILI